MERDHEDFGSDSLRVQKLDSVLIRVDYELNHTHADNAGEDISAEHAPHGQEVLGNNSSKEDAREVSPIEGDAALEDEVDSLVNVDQVGEVAEPPNKNVEQDSHEDEEDDYEGDRALRAFDVLSADLL